MITKEQAHLPENWSKNLKDGVYECVFKDGTKSFKATMGIDSVLHGDVLITLQERIAKAVEEAKPAKAPKKKK